MLIVKRVIKLEMDQLAPATALTSHGELMEIRDCVSEISEVLYKLHEQKAAICD